MERVSRKYRILSLLLTICMVVNMVDFVIPFAAATEPSQITATLYSGDVMPNGDPETSSAMLFKTYLSEARNPNDDITLAMNAGQPFEITDDAIQLGTSSAPFAGTIRFNAISDSYFNAAKALFAYLSTDAQFLTSGGAAFTNTISFTRIDTDADHPRPIKNSALFADHIVKGSGDGTISLNIACESDGDNNVTYAGLLGEIGSEVIATVSYTNNASSGGFSSNVFSQGNVGLICGVLGEDAALNVTLSGSYTKAFEEVKASGNGFTVSCKWYVDGKDLAAGDPLCVGDKVTAKYTIWNEENRSFVRISAPRPASLRPVNQLSGHYGWWLAPLSYGGWTFNPNGYRNVLADKTEYWFDSYPEENTTITEEFYVTQEGAFQVPAIEIESLYAPHYRANGEGRGSLVSR